MIDDKVIELIDKIAAQDNSVGSSQVKRRVDKSSRNFAGEGAGLGAVLGAVSGSLAKKYKPFTTAAGATIGALGGKYFGKNTKSKTKKKTEEGVMKKQERRTGTDSANVPRLNGSEILKLENK